MVDPSKKVPDLNCEVQDLLLEVVDLKQEVPDLRSGGIPLNLTPGLLCDVQCLQCLTLLVERQEGHPACKKLSGGVLAW